MTPKPVLVVILFTLLLQLSQVSSLNFENANQNDDEAAISPSDDDGQHLLQRGGFSVARPSCALTKNCSTIYNAVCVYKTEEKGEKSLLRKGTCACKIGQFLEDGSRCILIQCHSNEDCHRGLDQAFTSSVTCDIDSTLCICAPPSTLSKDGTACLEDDSVAQIFLILGILTLTGLLLCCCLSGAYCLKVTYDEYHRKAACKSNLAHFAQRQCKSAAKPAGAVESGSIRDTAKLQYL